MKDRMSYTINASVKGDYDKYILEEYGHKRNRCGSELEKAVKLYLTINRASDYGDDPDVKAMIESIRAGSPCTHTQSIEDTDNNINDLVDEIKEVRKELAKVNEKLAEFEENTPKKVNNDMDMFVQIFQDQYGNDHQISYKDISKLIMKTHNVIDERSIMNRVEYLVASGCIEPFAPNVYNVIQR